MSQVLTIRACLPAADVAVSRRFYQSLGFRVTQQDDSATVLKMGDCSFILCHSPNKVAGDVAVQMLVRNLDQWWQGASPERLVAEFAVRAPTPPAVQPGGTRVGFITDPVGVRWHITEVPF
jgi:catechol 2,3-dioxygenase-like lactoylglutathione lyase family enzyme